MHTDSNTTLGDHGTVDLEDDTVNLLNIVGVRDHLVAGEEILYEWRISKAGLFANLPMVYWLPSLDNTWQAAAL